MFIQNNSLEGPGALAGLFAKDGLDCTTIPTDSKIPQRAEGPVVILGGPQGANDDSRRLRDQEELIRWCHSHDVPVLGICLGSQLVAKALGGKVCRGTSPEVGFFDDVVPDTSHSLFDNITKPYTVFHWHQDTFTIPTGGLRLAGSPSYKNQAFMHGSVVGMQFHIELDMQTANTWLHHLEMHPFGGADVYSIRESMYKIERIHDNLAAFYSRYKRQFNL